MRRKRRQTLHKQSAERSALMLQQLKADNEDKRRAMQAEIAIAQAEDKKNVP